MSLFTHQLKILCSSANPVLFNRPVVIVLTCLQSSVLSCETFLLSVSVRWCTCPWACEWACAPLAPPISVLCPSALMMRKRAMLTRERERERM